VASVAAVSQRTPLTSLRRFFRAPKGLAIIALVVLLVPAALGEGVARVAPVVAAAVVTAMALDVVILRWREGKWLFPDGALLTGLFVGMILSPQEPWRVAAATAVIAIVSKYILRARNANIFNPAALALVVAFYVYHTGQSWWGALPDLASAWLVLLFAVGVFITDRVNKTPAVVTFLGVYYLLFTTAAFVGDPGHVAALYRAPDLHATLFFAFFMVTDPPTSPPKHRQQVVFGALTAVVAFAVFQLLGWVYFLLAGLLVANAWEAGRRTFAARSRRT
jgi:Na+-translocating ferredoxin:NAD+ oxidoreductase RnfD subunit